MGTLSYRLRIRTPNDDADALILSTVPSDDYPYISEPPTGDGQTLDPVAGKVSVGAYTVRVIDAEATLLLDAVGATVASDNFNGYADTAALKAAWTEIKPHVNSPSHLTLSAAGGEAGSKALTTYQTSVQFLGQYAAHRTFTGLTPNAAVVATVRVKLDFDPTADGEDSNGGLVASPTAASSGDFGSWQTDFTATGTFYTLTARTVTSATGTLDIRLGFVYGVAGGGGARTVVFDTLTITTANASPTAIETRIVTGHLTDQTARQQLLSRKAYVEESTDLGATWPTVLTSGYVNSIRLVTALEYEFTVGESKRIEQSVRVFDRITDPVDYPDGIGILDRTCCILGGPIIGDFGPTADRGRPTYRVKAVDSGNNLVDLEWVGGYLYHGAFHEGAPPIDDTTYKFLNDAALDYLATESAILVDAPFDHAAPLPNVVARLYNASTGAWIRDCTPWAREKLGAKGYTWRAFTPDGGVTISWDTEASLPSVGDRFQFAMFPEVVSARNPIHVSDHPVGVYMNLAASKGIAVDVASAEAVILALGPMVVDFRIFEGAVFEDWVTAHLFGPFGFTTRAKSDGTRELITTRVRPAALPTTLLTSADLVSDAGTGFELDEASAAVKVTFESRSYRTTDARETATPIDSIAEAKITLELKPDDPIKVFGDREIRFEVPGKIRGLETGVPTDPGTLDLWAAAQFAPLFDWQGRGQVRGEFHVLRGHLDELVGDEIVQQIAYVPNAADSQTPTSQRGTAARRCLILRRTEHPEGPVVLLMDRGPADIDDPASDPPSFVECPAYDAPTDLAGVVNGTSVALTWTDTEDLPVEVLAKLATASVYSSVTTLPAGSTTYLLTLSLASTEYDVAVRHREPAPGICTSDPDSISVTTDALLTLTAPVDPAAFADGLGAYGLAVTATDLLAAVEVWEAPETAVGSATAGTYTLMTTVPSVAGGRTVANSPDRWPNDGTLVFQKARHTRAGYTASDYTAEVSINPWAAVPPTDPGSPPDDGTNPPLGLTALTLPITFVTGAVPLGLRDIPASATPLTTHRGTEKQLPTAGMDTGYIGASIPYTTADVGAVVAFQFEDPDTPDSWDYLDGVDGPQLPLDEASLDALDPGGALRTPKCWVVNGEPVTLTDLAKSGRVRWRAVVFGGTGTEDAILSELSVYPTSQAANTPPTEYEPPPIENPGTCSSEQAETFESYADTAALLAAWPETDPFPFLTVALDTTTAYAGSKSIKLTEAAGGPYGGDDAYVSKTFTGYGVGQTVPVTAQVMPSRNIGVSTTNFVGFRANGVIGALPAGSTAGAWHEVTAVATADGSGHVVVQLGYFDMTIATGSGAGDFITHIDALQVCAPTTGMGDGNDPVPDPPTGGYPAPPVGGARPFAIYGIAAAGFGFWNGTVKAFTPGNAAALADAIVDAGSFDMLRFGSDINWLSGGVFSYDKWKAYVDSVLAVSANSTAITAGIAAGNLWSCYILDEPHHQTRYGGPVPLATLDRMCQYIKSLFPTWRTMIATRPDITWYNTRAIVGLDCYQGDYSLPHGDPATFRDANINGAVAFGADMILGLHYDDFTGAGAASPRPATPDEVRHYGRIIATPPPSGPNTGYLTPALLGWRWTTEMYGQTGMPAAVEELRDYYASFS